MNILRGTFRISLVVAVLAGIWGGVSEWKRPADDFGRQYDQVWQAQETLKCGKRSVEFSPDETVQHATNVYGNIDLSQLGCATTSFFTNPDELSRDPAAL